MKGIRSRQTLVGIGLGPANLSLAALIEGSIAPSPLKSASAFFEKRSRVEWHPGQLFPGARMQNTFVRDLVTLADPTNSFSFLSFLRDKGRLLQFLNSGQLMPTREEFVQYFQWVADQLTGVNYSAEVLAVTFDKKHSALAVSYKQGGQAKTILTDNVVLGTGLEPKTPPIKRATGDSCFHVCEFFIRNPSLQRRHVMVVGSAQSAAELMAYLLELGHDERPKRITWLARDSTLRPLDTGNFSREFYTPGYAHYFYGLPTAAKSRILASNLHAESGISQALLEQIYQAIYYHKYVARTRFDVTVLPDVTVREITSISGAPLASCSRNGNSFELRADCIILCTGFGQSALPRISLPGLEGTAHAINEDYSLKWNGPRNLLIFVQSFARETHGLSDPNFTMVCHRNSVIINKIVGRTVFKVEDKDLLAAWAFSGQRL